MRYKAKAAKAFLAFLVLALLASAASAATIVSIQSVEAPEGGEITAQIIAHNVTDLNQFGIKLDYDPAIVNATGAVNNPNFPDNYMGLPAYDFEHASDGYVLIGSVQLGATPESGTDVLLTTVTLKSVGSSGTSALGLTITKLKNVTGDISATVSNGTFTITGEPDTTDDIVINEFVSDNDTEWIELYNNGTAEVPLTDWTINDSNQEILTLSGAIGAKGFRIFDISGKKLNNGGDSIILMNNTGVVVDNVTYSGAIPNATVPGKHKSAGRYPNGIDTNNDSADFIEFDIPTRNATNTITSREVTTITVTPESSVSLIVGGTQQFEAAAYDQVGNEMTGVVFAWSSSNETVGTIGGAGFFTADAAGSTTVNATNGSVVGATIVTVTEHVTTAPSITDYAPVEAVVNDIEGATRAFNITVDQMVNVSWQINGTEVFNQNDVTESTYTNTSAEVGCWNVSSVASNENDTVMQKWVWTVTEVIVTEETYVSIQSVEAPEGGEITAQIIAHNVTDLNQFGIKLDYDPAIVNATGAVNNPNFPDNYMGLPAYDFEHASDGYVLIGSVQLGATPESGTDVLLTTVTLKSVGSSGTSALGLTITKLKNVTGDISATVSNGTFTITGEPDTTDDIVINEFVSNNDTEWVELYNNGTESVDLTDWVLEDGAGATKSLSGTIPAGVCAVFSYNTGWLNDGGDIIYLNNTTANFDKVAYGNWDDGNTADNAPAPDAGESAGRFPNGIDTDDDYNDFEIFGSPTPGAANAVTAPTYGVTISQPTNGTTVEGVNATYLLTIKNTGDADTYTLEVTNIDSATTAALNMTTIALDAGASGVVALDVTNTTAGTFNVTVNATSVNATNTTGYIMTTVELASTPTYGVTISQPTNGTTVEGVNATYLLTIKNTGDADTYTLEVTNIDSATTAALNMTTIALDAGASGVVALDVTNTTAGTFNVTVNATSVNATNTTGYIMTTVELASTPTYGVTISQPTNGTTVEGVNATYLLTIKNTGDADTYTLEVTNIDGATIAALNMTSITLDAAAAGVIALDVTNATAGTFNVTVNATSVNATNTTGYIMTTVEVRTYGVTVSQPTNGTTVEGVNATYLLTIKNTGDADTYTLGVTNIDGATTAALNMKTIALDAGASDVVALDVTNATIGTFNVTVNATSQTDSDANCTTSYIMTTIEVKPVDDGGSSGGSSSGDGTYPPGWDDEAPAPAAATPAPAAAEPTVASTKAPTEAPTKAPTKAPTMTATEITTTEMQTTGIPGFGAVLTVFAIAGLLVAAYLVMRRRE